MKQWMFVLILVVSAIAEDIVTYPPVFAYVTGVAEDDALNVRAKPDYRSKKIASLPNEAYVGVDECCRIGHSIWCRIHHMAQYDYEGYGWDGPEGWVNAKYLLGKNDGYVLIDQKANCHYILGCENGMCDLADEYALNKNYEIISLKTKKIARARLKGESHFGAMSPEEGGYCTNGNKIDDYLKRRGVKRVSHFSSDPAYLKALDFVKKYDPFWPENLAPFIYPKEGLRIGYDTHFTSRDRHLFLAHLKHLDDAHPEKFLWGYQVNDERVDMSMLEMLKWLQINLALLKEVAPLPDLRGFSCPDGAECKGYVFYSYDKPREIDFGWEGMVVIVGKIDGKWYVLGLLRDRWTI